MQDNALELTEAGKKAFQDGDFKKAVDLFQEAIQHHEEGGNILDAAEAKNNLSVALLQLKKAEEALEAAKDTDTLFAKAGDTLRQAMALGNQAAALDALNNQEEALRLYEQSAALFGEIDESEYQETVLKSIAALKLRDGKLQDTAYTMLDSLNAAQKPTVFQRILKFLLRIIR